VSLAVSYHSLPCRVIEGMTRGEYERLRAELVEEALGLCPYCVQPFPVVVRNQWARPQATVEHIEPRSRGGTDQRSNLTVACYSCNSSKSDKPLIVFLAQKKW
jgi:5-methylcytosine-specific restriction endonuclease McrA